MKFILESFFTFFRGFGFFIPRIKIKKIIKSFGMPSGHSQTFAFISTLIGIHLYNLPNKQSNIYNELIASCTPYNTTEWEIPKGRKNSNESNIMCAMREFKEETTLDRTSYNILKCIEPIHDVFSGTNNKMYKHIFYTALAKNNSSTINISIHNNNEIDEIKWCSCEEAIMLLRSYNINKINILTNLFMCIINICESNDLKTTL